ncbi:YidB family protein [Methylobacterium segetis]|uniref:YidB family protein n=1 Tax=Methylobacterium segetis TaxID=2488750 RepID=UPI00104D7259|nr:YidB family protein [Methylobacterium segetis]
MGLLDSVIGGVLGQVLGGGRGSGGPGSAQGGPGMSPLVKALLMLLLAKGASGGFGDIFGRGGPQHRPDDEPGPEDDRSGGAGPYGRDDRDPSGDIGGFNQGGYDPSGARRDGPPPREGDYSDLSGMLDGPGDAGSGRGPGAGPYAHLDREPGDPFGQGGQGGQGGPDLGGLDGLVERFQRGGLGDVIGSWIGHGQNRPVQPNQLAQALGPDTLDTLERQTGMNRDTLLSQLAQVLPEVINGLTPQGRVPGEEERRRW